MIHQEAILSRAKQIDASLSILDESVIKGLLTDEYINYIYIRNNNLSYNNIWKLQNIINELVYYEKVQDTVLFLEHEHVITLGKNADKNFLIGEPQNDTELIYTDRGGQITYHGPGQLIIYPIIKLTRYQKSITWYMDFIHNVIINYLDNIEIKSHRKKEYPGVWVGDNKICAVGVRIKRWVTMHGLALNISTDLTRYKSIIPCGIRECGITSIQNEHPTYAPIQDSVDALVRSFNERILERSEA